MAALNRLRGLIASAPEFSQGQPDRADAPLLVTRCAATASQGTRLSEPETATKAGLRAVARRIENLQDEITVADQRITAGVAEVAPTTLSLAGVGPQVAAQLLVSVGDNPDRRTGIGGDRLERRTKDG